MRLVDRQPAVGRVADLEREPVWEAGERAAAGLEPDMRRRRRPHGAVLVLRRHDRQRVDRRVALAATALVACGPQHD